MVYFVCGNCSSGTSENFLKLIHRVIQCSDIRKCLITSIQHILHYRVMVGYCYLSDIENCLRFGASCSPERNWCDLYCVYSCVFYLWVTVRSRAAESVFIVFQRGWMENDVNLYSLPSPLWSYFTYCYSVVTSLLLRFFAFTFWRMDFWEKTSYRMFCDVA